MASINDPIVQIKAIELIPPEPTFLYDTLVEDGGAVEEGEVIFDYRKGAIDGMAPFVGEDVGGVPIERKGFETRHIDFPTLAPERIIEKKHIMKRSFGEVIYGGSSPDQRAKKLMAEDLKFLKSSIRLRLEWMTAELLTTGKLTLPTYTEHGVLKSSKFADFGFTNSSTLSANKWNTSTADILGDLDDMYNEVINGLGQVDMYIMAPNVAEAMMNNETFLKKHDISRAVFGEVKPKYMGVPGVRYIGTNNDGIEMYSYNRTYVNDEGVSQPFIPANSIFAVQRKMFKSLYGPVTMIQKDGENFKTYVAPMVPYRNSYADSNTMVQRVISRPILMPKNVDGWSKRVVL